MPCRNLRPHRAEHKYQTEPWIILLSVHRARNAGWSHPLRKNQSRHLVNLRDLCYNLEDASPLIRGVSDEPMNIWLRADGRQNVSKIKEHIQSLCRVATRHLKWPEWLKTQSYKRNTDRKSADLLDVGLISHIWLATHGWWGGLWLGGNQGPTGWGSTEIPGWALDYFAKCTLSQNHRMKPSGASCPFKLKGHTHGPSNFSSLVHW